MPLKNNQIQLAMNLKDAILDAYNPEAVILFGSLGRGDGDEFSDVDLLVIMETLQEPNELKNEISQSLDCITTDKHIIVKRVNEFIHQLDIPGTLVFPAMNEGQILFDKNGLCKKRPSTDSYVARKQAVIQTEYLQRVREYLSLAESSLGKNNLFRCRDFVKFAAIRAIKSLFVKHDIHPPRETDLVQLFYKTEKLEPGLIKYIGFLRRLNTYRPGKAGRIGGGIENPESAAVLKSTVDFVEYIKRAVA